MTPRFRVRETVSGWGIWDTHWREWCRGRFYNTRDAAESYCRRMNYDYSHPPKWVD